MGSSACSAFSKGVAQKVRFIAFVLHEPQSLFIDEAFAILELQARSPNPSI
jgi:ABC-type uncharacterized transport system ATPase subunit